VEKFDIALQTEAVAGSRRAAESLFIEAYPAVYNFCRYLVISPSDAEDLTQETFLRALQHLSKFRPSSPMKPWLLTIAHNLVISFFRKRRPSSSLEDAPEAQLVSLEGLPETFALAQDERLRINLALCRLKPELRVVILLRYQQRLTYEEIAKAISKPLSTVTNRLFEARRRLGGFLSESDIHEGGNDAVPMVRS
jgi:RNA polymerase sigma-70 factor (ECF subfamily)